MINAFGAPSAPRRALLAGAAAALLSAALFTATLGCGSGPPQKPNAPTSKSPIASLRATPGGIDGKPLLAPDAARATASGAGALQILGADLAAEGDRVGGFVEI